MGVIPAKAALLDLDGVLIDSYEAWRRTVKTAVREGAGRTVTDEEVLAAWGQGIHADRGSWFPHLGIGEIAALYERIFPQHLDSIVVFPGAVETLRRLRGAGFLLAIVTNTQRSLAGAVLERFGFLPLLDALACGDDVPEGKPAPGLLLLACDRLGIPPADAVMVGDTTLDRDAARAAGIVFLGIGIEGDRTLGSVEELPALLGYPG